MSFSIADYGLAQNNRFCVYFSKALILLGTQSVLYVLAVILALIVVPAAIVIIVIIVVFRNI